jgi:hypothetical protein
MISRKNKENILWCIVACAMTLGLVWQFIRLPDGAERLAQLYPNGPGYSSTELSLTPQEKSFFNEINMIKRLYVIHKEKYFIYILDGTADRHAVHDPTYCFRGDGWKIVSQKDIPIDKGYAGLYTLEKGNKKKQALLWFSDGKTRYSWPMHYWFAATLRRLTLGWSGQEPLLFVVQPLNDDPKWLDHLDEIVSILNI